MPNSIWRQMRVWCWDSPPTIANMGSWTWIDLEGAQQLWRVSLCFQRV
jgi:hypothetical protein